MKHYKHFLRKLRMAMLVNGMAAKRSAQFWLFSPLSEEDRKIKHRKECDQILLNIPGEYRLEFVKWLEKKAEVLIYENTKDKTTTMQDRLFQTALERNQVMALHEAALMKEQQKVVDKSTKAN